MHEEEEKKKIKHNSIMIVVAYIFYNFLCKSPSVCEIFHGAGNPDYLFK